jgi:hypothetical protein
VEYPWKWLAPAAAVGFMLAVLWHLAAWARMPIAEMSGGASALFVGIFVVWFPTVFRLRKINSRMQSWNGALALLEGAPRWMQLGAIALFGYTIVNFFVAFGADSAQAARDAFETARGFSGHTMLFYGMAAVMNYAHDRRTELGLWKCTAGHDVSPQANFCETCGARVNEPTAARSRR